MRKFLLDHPDVIPAAAAVMVAVLAWRMYRYGNAVGVARALRGEADRLASEALGG